MARVTANVPSARLHVIGQGPKHEDLVKLAYQYGLEESVTFHGQRPQAEVPLWYSAADVVVLPSSSEGLPRVMLEAMSCGAVFIGCEISGVRDHIQDGETGFIVPLRDEHALADRIESLLTDDDTLAQVGARAASYIRTTLTWSAVVFRLRAALLNKVGDRSGHDQVGELQG